MKNGILILLRRIIHGRQINIEYIDGHVIKMDLLFSKQKAIKIIGIYNPYREKETNKQIAEQVQTWIQEANRLD